MAIGIFTDNDVIFKLARYDLLTVVLELFQSQNYVFRYLDALPYVAGVNAPQRATKIGLTSAQIGSIEHFIAHSAPVEISDKQVLEIIAQLHDPNLDAGELILTFGAQENQPAGLFTGDKRAIKVINRMQQDAIFYLEDCQILVLEEAIRILMRCGNREQVITRIQSCPTVDKSLDICFRNVNTVDEALQSYIQQTVNPCAALTFVQLEKNAKCAT